MNLEHPILSADGGRYFAVGGPSAYKIMEHRGYTASFEWVDGEPAMLMYPTRGGFDAGVFGICLSSAAKYADPNGDPTRECWVEALRALPVLGKSQIDIECQTLVACIIHWMPELLHMPYCPRDVRVADRPAPVWEISHKDQNGRLLSEATI